MNEKKIVAVQFKSKADPTGFGGREYTYYSTVDLAVGDVIVVPTKRGRRYRTGQQSRREGF